MDTSDLLFRIPIETNYTYYTFNNIRKSIKYDSSSRHNSFDNLNIHTFPYSIDSNIQISPDRYKISFLNNNNEEINIIIINCSKVKGLYIISNIPNKKGEYLLDFSKIEYHHGRFILMEAFIINNINWDRQKIKKK